MRLDRWRYGELCEKFVDDQMLFSKRYINPKLYIDEVYTRSSTQQKQEYNVWGREEYTLYECTN